MGNATVAEDLPGADELDELYRLDASEPEPEPAPAPEPDDEHDDEDDGTFQPEDRPHP